LQKLLASIALGLFFTTCLHAGESKSPLTIEMSDPKVRITIPGMSGIDMTVHPMNEQTPVFRLRGSSGGTSVSIITPKIDTAVSPMACASAIANVVLSQLDVTREQLFLGRSNEQTFLIIYGLPMFYSTRTSSLQTKRRSALKRMSRKYRLRTLTSNPGLTGSPSQTSKSSS
jgi:hypothetical protein